VDNSLSISLRNEASPEQSDLHGEILNMIDSDPNDQEDPFALKF
jgi:hypothetical protein